MREWKIISKDGLPDNILKEYICCLENGCIAMLVFSNVSGKGKWINSLLGREQIDNPVLAYMELPDPPKEFVNG